MARPNLRQFWHITLPLLGATTVFVLSTTIIQAFQIFEPIFIMTNPAGGSKQRHTFGCTLPVSEWLPELPARVRFGGGLAAFPTHLYRDADSVPPST